MDKIRILLVEDNRLLRESISAMLKKESEMRLVGTVSNGENLLEAVEKLKPGITLLELGLKEQNSLHFVKEIKRLYADTKIVVMDLLPMQRNVFEYVQAGVSGFILKDASASEFVKTIRAVNNGTNVLPQHLAGSLFSQIVDHAIKGTKLSLMEKSVRMTKREKQVIELIAEGSTNKEIAEKLHLSTYTVKSHVHNILEKLSLSTRVQIAKHAHLAELNKTSLDGTSLIDE